MSESRRARRTPHMRPLPGAPRMLARLFSISFHGKQALRKVCFTYQAWLGRLWAEMESMLYRGGAVKNRLEELRHARDMSQEELAAALDVTRQTICSLEKGRYNPSIVLAFKIARYFGLTIEDVFIYQEECDD